METTFFGEVSEERRPWAIQTRRRPGCFRPAYRLPFAVPAGEADGTTDNAVFFRAGEVKVLHPLALLARRGRFSRRLARSFAGLAAMTFGNRRVMVAEAHRQRIVETHFDPYLRSAQSGPHIRTRDPVDLVVELDGVVVGHLPGLHIAQRSRQRMRCGKRPVRIVCAGGSDRQLLVPPWKEGLFQVGIGLFQSSGFEHSQPFH